MRTGMARASEPNNKYGFRKDMSRALRASRQVVEQSHVKRLAGIHQTIINACSGKLFPNAFHVLVENHEILLTQVLRNDMQLLFRLHIFKLGHILERKREFEIVHDVKNDNVVALSPQRLQTRIILSGSSYKSEISTIRPRRVRYSARKRSGLRNSVFSVGWTRSISERIVRSCPRRRLEGTCARISVSKVRRPTPSR